MFTVSPYMGRKVGNNRLDVNVIFKKKNLCSCTRKVLSIFFHIRTKSNYISNRYVPVHLNAFNLYNSNHIPGRYADARSLPHAAARAAAACRSQQILFTRSFAQSLTRSRIGACLYAELLNFELK